jgi:hypothetical protein
MSLLRLLTSGKSLVGLKNADTRYHLPGQRGLPQFGSKKNPFRATALPEKLEQPQAAEAAATPAAVKETPGEGDPGSKRQALAVSREVASSDSCAEQPAGAGGHTSKPSCKPGVRGERRGFGMKALLVWARTRKAHPGAALVGRQMVQGELSLDKVKVVRNDLSESDLEVRRGVSCPINEQGSSSNSPILKEPIVQPAGWGVAAERLLGLGKM